MWLIFGHGVQFSFIQWLALIESMENIECEDLGSLVSFLPLHYLVSYQFNINFLDKYDARQHYKKPKIDQNLESENMGLIGKGFTMMLGVIGGIYIAQKYTLPNITKNGESMFLKGRVIDGNTNIKAKDKGQDHL